MQERELELRIRIRGCLQGQTFGILVSPLAQINWKDKCFFMLYNDVLPCIAIHFIFHAQQKKAREKRKKRSYTN